MTVQPQNNNLNYLIDPTFTNDLLFKRIAGENNPTKDYWYSFSHYYVPNAKIKDFNVLTDGKSFSDLPVKMKKKLTKKLLK